MKLAILFLITVINLSDVLGLKCIVCDTSTFAPADGETRESCKNGEDGFSQECSVDNAACKVIYTVMKGNDKAVRQCVSDKQTPSCKQPNKKGDQTCICKTDNCNNQVGYVPPTKPPTKVVDEAAEPTEDLSVVQVSGAADIRGFLISVMTAFFAVVAYASTFVN